jgi:hypothetical protein
LRKWIGEEARTMASGKKHSPSLLMSNYADAVVAWPLGKRGQGLAFG